MTCHCPKHPQFNCDKACLIPGAKMGNGVDMGYFYRNPSYWFYETTTYQKGYPITNGMNDAIDNEHPYGKKGTSSWGARTVASRIDDFSPEPIIQASLTKMGSGSSNF